MALTDSFNLVAQVMMSDLATMVSVWLMLPARTGDLGEMCRNEKAAPLCLPDASAPRGLGVPISN